MDISVYSGQLWAQRYFDPDSGDMSVISVEEIAQLIGEKRDRDSIKEQYPFLLDSSLEAAYWYHTKQSGLLYSWLEAQAENRTKYRLLIDDEFSPEVIAFLQDQVGATVRLQDYHRQGCGTSNLKKIAQWASSLNEFDCLLLTERTLDSSRASPQKNAGRLGKMFCQASDNELVDSQKITIGFIYWGENEEDKDLIERLQQLRSFLPRLLKDKETCLFYASDDLAVYPPIHPDDIERFKQIFMPRMAPV